MADHGEGGGEAAREFRAHGGKLLGATIGLGCGVGLYTPISSLFFRALEGEFHWSKAASALSFVALPATAVALPFIGGLVDRLGVRAVALGSSLCFALGLALLSLMNGALAQFYLLFLLMNVLAAGTGPVAYTRVVAARFKASRGLALAVALLGIALAGMLLPPLIAHVIAAAGWRSAYRVLAVIALVGGVGAALLVGRREDAPAHASGSSSPAPGLSLGQAVRTRSFWILGAALLFISAASFGMTSQLQSIGIEKGLAPEKAALLISLLGLSIAPSRLIVGWALDSTDPRRASALALALASAGAWLTYFAPPGGVVQAAAGVALVGASIGAELDLMSYFCAHCFGLRRFGVIYGCVGIFFYVGIALGGVGYGAIHDAVGHYGPALALSALLLAAAGGLLLLLPRHALDGANGLPRG